MRESLRPRRQDWQDTNHAINQFFGYLIPIALLGAAGYAVWVVVIAACGLHSLHSGSDRLADVDPANYLLNLSPKRPRTAIAILVVFFILLALWFLCYLRILITVLTNPGYVPRNDSSILPASTYDVSPRPNRRNNKSGEKHGSTGRQTIRPAPITRRAILDGRIPPPPGIEYFYFKDIFVCDDVGLPIFCEKCLNWKPDRTHHCSEVNRCVRRMDHFCPWVGGVVSETNMKFFIQMVVYGFLFSAFVFGVFVWLCTDHNRRVHDLNGNFIAITALGGVFCVICLGMMLNSLHLALKNMTTVESLGNVYFLAIHIPDPEQHGAAANIDGTTEPRPYFHTITYPIPPRKSSNSSRNTHSPHASDPEAIVSSTNLRTFAIVPTSPGDNPWDIGRLNNLKSILGERYIDWILPIRNSPCCSHDNPESDYPLGLDVERVKREYGLDSRRPPSGDRPREKRRRRQSHRHRQHHRRTQSSTQPNTSSEASDRNR